MNGVLQRIVVVDECWAHYFQLDTKRANKEGRIFFLVEIGEISYITVDLKIDACLLLGLGRHNPSILQIERNE